MSAPASPLISAEELRAELGADCPPTVLDVRWRLDAPDGRAAFEAAHIPGSVYASLDDVFSEHQGPPAGRHPLPSAQRLATGLAALGIAGLDEPIVTLDDASSWPACRAWWVLRDAGFTDVRVLDGGWSAWVRSGAALEHGPVAERPAPELSLTLGHMPQLSIDDAATLPTTGLLLDARAPERFRGELEPIDPRAGHIPGARNLPVSSVFDSDGRFAPISTLKQVLPASAVAACTIGVYCGSGVSASPLVLAYELIGQRVALYPGSWSQWSNDPARPIATGDE